MVGQDGFDKVLNDVGESNNHHFLNQSKPDCLPLQQSDAYKEEKSGSIHVDAVPAVSEDSSEKVSIAHESLAVKRTHTNADNDESISKKPLTCSESLYTPIEDFKENRQSDNSSVGGHDDKVEAERFADYAAAKGDGGVVGTKEEEDENRQSDKSYAEGRDDKVEAERSAENAAAQGDCAAVGTKEKENKTPKQQPSGSKNDFDNTDKDQSQCDQIEPAEHKQNASRKSDDTPQCQISSSTEAIGRSQNINRQISYHDKIDDGYEAGDEEEGDDELEIGNGQIVDNIGAEEYNVIAGAQLNQAVNIVNVGAREAIPVNVFGVRGNRPIRNRVQILYYEEHDDGYDAGDEEEVDDDELEIRNEQQNPHDGGDVIEDGAQV